MNIITDSQLQILRLVDTHGPLSFEEIARSTVRPWRAVNEDIRYLQRKGFVLIFRDDRVRLGLLARKAVERYRA
jgi:predicted transcriptional regulator